MKIGKLLQTGLDILNKTSSSPQLDAELLLMHASGLTREKLRAYPELEVSADVEKAYTTLVNRRAKHEPVAYLLGYKEFWGLPLKVNPSVLIPRPETELMVEAALDFLRSKNKQIEILELGTGSGAISVAVAHELKKMGKPFALTALDISTDALKVAVENAATHGVADSITFVQSDWFSNLENSQKRYDLVVVNPPYIAANDREISPELSFEPRSALFSGESGLEAIEKILVSLPKYLKADSLFLCEIGATQRILIEKMVGKFVPGCKEIRFLRDLASLDRLVYLKFC